jgi:regulator of sigma E protease
MSYVIAGILGLALLMVVHESGHLLVARAFGMRVIRFSIGFGPPLWRYQAKGSETVYQVALIPFLAYVQIAGMNPFEENDPNDKGSYANASLLARISAIIAGPLANYLFASVLFFIVFAFAGKSMPTTTIKLADGPGPARIAQMKDGDTIVSVNGAQVKTWDEMRKQIAENPNKPLDVAIDRSGKPVMLKVTPELKAGEGRIGVQTVEKLVPLGVKDAAAESLKLPAKVVSTLVVSLARIMTLQIKPELTGPVGIVRETSRAAEQGWPHYVYLLGLLSAYLGGFNALPFPALDGGRLAFLGYEAVTRRRPNAKVEAQVHLLGLVMLLALIAVVSVFDIKGPN